MRAADLGARQGRAQSQLLPAGGVGPLVLTTTHTDCTNSLLQQEQFKETFTLLSFTIYFFTQKIRAQSLWDKQTDRQTDDALVNL